jgi:hypothetical protein
MTMTQKRWLETPILLMILWIFQALELSILHLPYYLGTPQLLTLIVGYAAFSRGWAGTAALAALMSFLASANVGYPTGLFVAAHIWAALGTKGAVSALTLEGRPAFVLLVVGYSFLLKVITLSLLKFAGASPTLPLFIAQFFSQTAIMALAAWIAYPLLRKWDDYFLHTTDDDSLGPQKNVLR